MILHRLITVVTLLTLLAVPAQAQDQAPPDPAVLVADEVYLDGNERLVAQGNVEAFFDGRRLEAERVIYERENDRLLITGPIRLEDDNNILILASEAELDEELQNGLLRGARLIMGNHVQLAAQEINRVGGRYNQLVKASVTSCQICDDGRPPLWQIRARRVIHDQEKQLLYFDNAQFRVLNTPIFYLPRLRLPDPTLKRASGFLAPSLVNSSSIGLGARIPYFIKIGDHKDLTVTPVIATSSRTLELRYRQAFKRGSIEFEGAIADDERSVADGGDNARAYIFGGGEFQLENKFVLRFDIELVTDETFLLDFDISQKDRLDSEIELERADRLSYARAAVTHFRSLRPVETNPNDESSVLPSLAAQGEFERRFFPKRLGGELRFGAEAKTFIRTSNLDTDGPDIDVFADGRDVLRVTLDSSYRRNWTLPAGVLAQFRTGLSLDTFDIRQAGVTSLSSTEQLTPSVAVQFRWPLLRSAGTGVRDVLEPIAQFAWVGGENPFVPLDESALVEFDEGNLFATSRFAAPDRRERGLSAAYGVQWTRFNDDAGWQSSLALGQVLRDEQQLEENGTDSFTNSSGLDGEISDLLVAGQYKSDNGLTLTARGLFDEDYDTTRAEARASWNGKRTSFGATYVWLDDDPVEERLEDTSELSFDTTYKLSRHWTGQAAWRYDIAQDRSISAGLGLTYSNECVDITLAASRRFTNSAILDRSTSINLTVVLAGFTNKTDAGPTGRSCEK